MLKFILRGALLPVDIVLLTIYFLRLTRWILRSKMYAAGGLNPLLASPCSYRRRGQGLADGGEPRVCLDAKLFRTPRILRVLCPCVRPVGRKRPGPDRAADCIREGEFFPYKGRYVTTGILLLLVWGLVAAGGVYGWKVARSSRSDRDAREESDQLEKAWLFARQGARLVEQGELAKGRLQYLNAIQADSSNPTFYQGLGECCFAMGSMGEAAEAFEEVLKRSPGPGVVHACLAEISFGREDQEKGLAHALKAVELMPQSAKAHYLACMGYRAKGAYESAMKHVRSALSLDSSPLDYWIVAGDVALANNQAELAKQYYRDAEKKFPDSNAPTIGIARALRLQGKSKQARQMLVWMLKDGRASDYGKEILADLYVETGELVSAIELYGDLAGKNPKNLEARARRAELLLRTGDLDAGQQAAANLLEDDPGNVAAHLILCEIYLRLDLRSLAIEHCQAATVLQEGTSRADKLFAQALIDGGLLNQAVAVLEALVDTAPGDISAYLSLAYCYEKTGEGGKAIACLEKAAAADPASALPQVQMGQLYLNRGDVFRAVTSYREALGKDVSQPAALNNLAVLLVEHYEHGAESLSEALRLARAAHRLLPADPAIADTLGWVLAKQKHYDEGLGYLAYACLKEPRNVQVRYHFGSALYAVGKYAAAEIHLKEALALDQDFVHADRAVALLDAMKRRSSDRLDVK